MGSNKPQDEGIPKSFPEDEADSIESFGNANLAGADTTSSSMPHSAAPVPWNNMQVNHPSYNHNAPETLGGFAGFSTLNASQSSQINCMNSRSNLPMQFSPPPFFPGFENYRADIRNYTLGRGSGAGGYQMTTHGGEQNRSHIYGPQNAGNFFNTGSSAPLQNYTQTRGEIGAVDNVNVRSLGVGSEKMDGRFLTLGIGNPTQPSSEEVSNRLDRIVSLQSNTSNVQPSSGSSLIPVHNMAGGFQPLSNTGVFPCVKDNAAVMTPVNNNVGGNSGTNPFLTPRSFHAVRRPRVELQRPGPTPSSRNLGFIQNTDPRYANINPYTGFLGNQATSSGPFASNSPWLPDSRQAGLSALELESAKHYHANYHIPTSQQQNFQQQNFQQQNFQLQNNHARTVQNIPPGSSGVSPFADVGRSFPRTEYPGQLSSVVRDGRATQASNSRLVLPGTGYQIPAGAPVAGAAAPAAAAGSFPNRLMGVDIGFSDRREVEAPECRCKRLLGVHINDRRDVECRLHPHPYQGAAQTSGQQFHRNMSDFSEPSSTKVPASTGGGQSLPITSSSEQLFQNSQYHGGTSTKRRSVQPPQISPSTGVQRRKLAIQSPSHPSFPPPQPPVHASGAPTHNQPPRMQYIKRQRIDPVPKLSGVQCPLCKRDLSFAAEGSSGSQNNPPHVAVLPCGHTFHDHCLQIITPDDQAKDPPCIPCALGDS